MNMKGACEGSTLVLGDGNFSFSLALAQRMGNPEQLTATTLGGEEEALRTHWDAGNNVQLLQEKGAVVIFGVDATDLAACLRLRGQTFDHVIFNFPHVGRKAPIQRNRELLRKVFTSCTDLQSAEGKVYVTLCQGQGGTPADQPQRAWHNSWQVVAMAAEAGLVLGEVVPFCAEDWEVYMPSGYRSRDKAFHTQGALTHIFRQSCPLAHVTQTAATLAARVEGTDRLFSKPVGIRHKIGRNLHQKEDHPVAMVTKQLCSLLGETFSVYYLKTEDFSIVCGSADIDMADALSDGQVKTRLIQVKEEDTEEMSPDHTCWYLRPSLITHLPTILQTPLQPGLMHILTGEVFCHCAVSTHTCPVQHQLLGVLLLPEHTGDSSGSRESPTTDEPCQVLPSTMPGALHTGPTTNLQQGPAIESKTQVASNLLEREDCLSDLLGLDLSTKCTFEDVKGSSSEMCSSVRCLEQIVSSVVQLDLAPSLSCSRNSVYLLDAGSTDTSTQVPIGQVFVVNQDTLPGCRIAGHIVVCFTLNLDRVAQLKFNIPDTRLLWTEDKRFYEQFRFHSHPATASVKYQGVSKFPPSKSYDVSFWENPDADFCEDDFMMLVRDVSHDVVTEVTVIDRYTQADTGRRSRCYRLTFQAPDRALSTSHVKEIMKELGKRLGQDLGLQVR